MTPVVFQAGKTDRGRRSRQSATGQVREHFDEVAAGYDRWKAKAGYYYEALKAAVAEVIPPGSRVLEVGCGTGDLLAFLEPSEGLGTDISPQMVAIAGRKHPDLRFEVHDLVTDAPLHKQFDYVLNADVMEHVPDPAKAMKTMAGMLTPAGKLVVLTANPVWAAVLQVAELLRLKMPEGDHAWRSRTELRAAALSAGLAETSFDRMLLVPKRIPLVAGLNNAGSANFLRQRLGLIQRAVFERR